MKRNIPSRAQAKRLAHIWANDKTVCVSTSPEGSYSEPTVRALVKQGWVAPNGVKSVYPSGAGHELYAISVKGIDALEDFFREERYRRK